MKRRVYVPLFSIFLILCASLMLAYHPARAATWNIRFEITGTCGKVIFTYGYSGEFQSYTGTIPKTITEIFSGFTLIETGVASICPGYSGSLALALYVDNILRDVKTTSNPSEMITVQYSDWNAVFIVIFIPLGIVMAVLVLWIIVRTYRRQTKSAAVFVSSDVARAQQQQQQQVATVNITPAQRFCIFCGKEIEVDATFCTSCGRRQG